MATCELYRGNIVLVMQVGDSVGDECFHVYISDEGESRWVIARQRPDGTWKQV